MFTFLCTFPLAYAIMPVDRIGQALAKPFDANASAASERLLNIFIAEELMKESTVSKMEIVQKERRLPWNAVQGVFEKMNIRYNNKLRRGNQICCLH